MKVKEVICTVIGVVGMGCRPDHPGYFYVCRLFYGTSCGRGVPQK